MGERGPLKLPRHLRPAGEPPADTVAEDVPPAAPDKPVGWTDYDGELSALWDELVPTLDEAGLLARCDGPAIEMMLRHFLAARRASAAMFAGDVVVEDPHHNGVKRNPAGSEFRGQSAAFLELAKQLGMTFASRARVPRQDSGGGQQGSNPFAA